MEETESYEKKPSKIEGGSSPLSGGIQVASEIKSRRKRKIGRLMAGFFALAFISVGCATTGNPRDQNIITKTEPGDAITILLNHSATTNYGGGWLSSEEAHALENKISRCVAKAMGKANSPLRIISADKFRGTAFPGMSFTGAPHSPEYLSRLVSHPAFQARVTPLGLRYLVIVDGESTSQSSGDIVCGGGYGGAGCFGVKIWEKSSRMEALILDIKGSAPAAEVTATAQKKAWFAVIGIIPIGMPASPESEACAILGEEIVNFIAHNTNPALNNKKTENMGR